MKVILNIILIMVASVSFSQAYDDCSDALANPLTVGGGLNCGFTATGATDEGGECLTNWAGAGNSTMWSSFVATDDSIVINYVETTSDGEYLAVYGPNTGCQPLCANEIFGGQQVGDPGHHILVTGLIVGATYLIQIDATDPNGPSTSNLDFCIGVEEPAANAYSNNATLIDECGVSFNETTDGGFWQNGTSLGFNNLDNNGATTCGTCAAGDDTPFIINNVAWNYFCSLTGGTWQLTVDNITNCTLSAPNAGVQISVFTGTTGALVNEGNSLSPQAPGSSYTSPTLTVNAGECAWVMIDGFAGDVCDYSVTLTNLSGGCVVLPLEFLGLDVYENDGNMLLNWTVASEIENSHFLIERSYDGEEYELIGEVESIGDHTQNQSYLFEDDRYSGKSVYYRLSSVNTEGEVNQLAYKFVKRKDELDASSIELYPNPANESIQIAFSYEGMPGVAQLEVYNMMGVKVKSEAYEVNPGLNNLELMLEELKAGNYTVKIISKDRVFTKSFLKR